MYSLFSLRKPCSPLRISGEQGFLGVNRLYMYLECSIGVQSRWKCTGQGTIYDIEPFIFVHQNRRYSEHGMWSVNDHYTCMSCELIDSQHTAPVLCQLTFHILCYNISAKYRSHMYNMLPLACSLLVELALHWESMVSNVFLDWTDYRNVGKSLFSSCRDNENREYWKHCPELGILFYFQFSGYE